MRNPFPDTISRWSWSLFPFSYDCGRMHQHQICISIELSMHARPVGVVHQHNDDMRLGLLLWFRIMMQTTVQHARLPAFLLLLTSRRWNLLMLKAHLSSAPKKQENSRSFFMLTHDHRNANRIRHRGPRLAEKVAMTSSRSITLQRRHR